MAKLSAGGYDWRVVGEGRTGGPPHRYINHQTLRAKCSILH
jgi:hypothetical protein